MKYGRAGKQKQRFVYLSKDEKRLYWKNSSKSMDKPRFIEVDEIYDILFGVNGTPNIEKFSVPPDYEEVCFSLITEFRSLDLRANDLKTRKQWEKYFKIRFI